MSLKLSYDCVVLPNILVSDRHCLAEVQGLCSWFINKNNQNYVVCKSQTQTSLLLVSILRERAVSDYKQWF